MFADAEREIVHDEETQDVPQGVYAAKRLDKPYQPKIVVLHGTYMPRMLRYAHSVWPRAYHATEEEWFDSYCGQTDVVLHGPPNQYAELMELANYPARIQMGDHAVRTSIDRVIIITDTAPDRWYIYMSGAWEALRRKIIAALTFVGQQQPREVPQWESEEELD